MDDEANKKLYGKDVNAKQIILQREVKTHPAGQSLNQLLKALHLGSHERISRSPTHR